MKSTIVIPNYNGIDFLKTCLDSLMECSPMDFRILVVDNGSTDGSVLLIREKYKNVDLIELKENTGFAYAVNVGIHASDTEYVILLNNDTSVERNFVSALEKVMDGDDRIFSASSKMVDMYRKDILDGAGDYYSALGWAFAYGKGKKVSEKCLKRSRIFSACAGAAIYRRELLENLGCFDENHFAYLEDVDLGYRARIKGYINVYEPSAICYHAGSGSSGSRYNEFKVNLSSRNSMYLVLKNMPLLQLVLNIPFLLIGFFVKTLFFTKKGYGKVYVRGLLKGIKLYNSPEGKDKKVKYRLKDTGNYILIQCELWINILRRLWA